MATVQNTEDKKTVGMHTEEYYGNVYTAVGSIQLYTGTGVPDHKAKKGSLYINRATGKLHVCETEDTAAAGSWKTVTVS